MHVVQSLLALCTKAISFGIDSETPKQMAITVRLTNFIAIMGSLNSLPPVIVFFNQNHHTASYIIGLVLPFYCLGLLCNMRRQYMAAKIIVTLAAAAAFGLFVLFYGSQISLAAVYFLHVGGTILMFSNRSERKVFLVILIFDVIYLSSLLVLAHYITPLLIFAPPLLHQFQMFMDISGIYLNMIIVGYFLSLFLAREQEIEKTNIKLQELNETLYRSNLELVTLNHEKNELMSIVAHDLKNPISVVHGMAGLIYHNVAPPEETQEMAHKIILTSDRMLELVTNLLELNRLEMGVFSFEIKHVNILPIIDSIVGQYEDSARLKDISIHVEKTPTQAIALVDEQVFISIVDNLLSNAIKFSLSGKQIVVRAIHGSDSQDSSSQASTIRIEIQDEGPGISPEEMTKLFGKFVRLSARPTGGEHSTGLGLSIVKKMVEAMQGRVWCESELGKGATFIVELPGV